MTSGSALWTEIQSRPVPSGQAALWFMGQHGFVIKLAGKIICIDLFLTAGHGRLVPPPLSPANVRGADLIIGTHDHLDHIDRPSWPAFAAASPDAVFVVPELVRQSVCAELKLDPKRLQGLDDGRQIDLGPLQITGVAAAHEFLDQDPATGCHRFLGCVIEAEGLAIYHAGDTCLYEGLLDRLRRWPNLALMLLPINGRDGRRLRKNILGNMTFQEAADLAGTIKPGLVVPAHFDMFAANLGDPDAFVDYVQVKYPKQPALVPRVGECFLIGLP
jgi:L-ascorbate metabolism protein UlaG (beta-lactamase superfamily)